MLSEFVRPRLDTLTRHHRRGLHASSSRITERPETLFSVLHQPRNIASTEPNTQQDHRNAHLALLDLRRVVDEAAQTAHAAELEAVHLAMSPRMQGDIGSKLRSAIEKLGSDAFQDSLSRARRSLQPAIS